MAELLSLFQFSPYDTKGLGHGWEELQVAGAYVVQQKKKMTGLNKLFRSFRRERAFRIIVNAPPNYPCVAAAELREEISRALEWLTKNVPAQDERRDRHQVDKLMKRFTKQLSRVEVPVPGTNGVPLHKLPTPELQKLQTSLSLANPNDKVLPAIWRELTQRELAQCEERWQQREEEKVPVKIVFDSTVVAEMELPVSMTGGELFAMLQAKKLLPEGATCPRLGSPSNRLDTLAKGQKLVFVVPPSVTSQRTSSAAAVCRSSFTPSPKAIGSSGEVPERPQFVPLAAPSPAATTSRPQPIDYLPLQVPSQMSPEVPSPELPEAAKKPAPAAVSTALPRPVVPAVTEEVGKKSDDVRPEDVPLPPSVPGTPQVKPSEMRSLERAATSDQTATPPGKIPTPPPTPEALRQGPPLLPHPPLPLKHLPGCAIVAPSSSTKTIWESNLDAIRPLQLQPEQWLFALDSAPSDHSRNSPTPHPTADQAGLLGVARERDVTITLKGVAMHGLMDLDRLVKCICTGEFPSDELKFVICELMDQFRSVAPTTEEVEVFAANPPVPGVQPVRAEEFFRLVIARGVDTYLRGLSTLELWYEGSDRLRDIEMQVIFTQSALKFVTTNRDFLSLLWPVASLVITLEEARSPNCNFPASVQLLISRKTSGKLPSGEQMSLLQWLYNCGVFSDAAIERLMEANHADTLAQVAELTEEDAALDQIEELCKSSIANEMVQTITAHVSQLRTMLKQLKEQADRMVLLFDPRFGKLQAVEVFESASLLITTLAQHMEEKKRDLADLVALNAAEPAK